jgi:hypothetical protein
MNLFTEVKSMADEKQQGILNDDLEDHIVDKIEDVMESFSKIDVEEMVNGINDLVFKETKED